MNTFTTNRQTHNVSVYSLFARKHEPQNCNVITKLLNCKMLTAAHRRHGDTTEQTFFSCALAFIKSECFVGVKIKFKLCTHFAPVSLSAAPLWLPLVLEAT